MKKNQYKCFQGRLLQLLAVMFFMLLTMTVNAQNTVSMPEPERKSDYFERVYFSGLNHAGIKSLYRASIQELEQKELSPAASRQFELLIALEKNIMDAQNSCDALEIIGAAIHELDEATAIKLQVPRPSEKVKGNLLNTLASTVAGNTDSMSKAGRTTARVQDFKETVDVFRGFIPRKDKPCKTIIPRVVEIGYHPTASEAAKNEIKEINGKKYKTHSALTIKNISFSQLTEIKNLLKKIEGIAEVKNNEYKDNIVALEIMHSVEFDDIVNQIISAKKQYKVIVESISGDDGVLIIK